MKKIDNSNTAPTVESMPEALDFERNILGAMMLDSSVVYDLIDILPIEAFYDPRHQYIYTAIRELFALSQPIDLLTVRQKLLANKTTFEHLSSYLSSLLSHVASTFDLERHAEQILEKFILRQLILTSHQTIKNAFDPGQDVPEVLNKAQADLFKISEGLFSKSAQALSEALPKVLAEIELSAQKKDGISGVPTGFYHIDKMTAGWQNSDMIVLAARPGMGKTALVLSMARNIAVDYNIGVAFFSLEMSTSQLLKRLIAHQAQINSEYVRNGRLTDAELASMHQHMSLILDAPLYIDDSSSLSIFDLRAKARRLKMQHDIGLIIIDYLQLLNTGTTKNGQTREQEISIISRSIKAIAKELDLPIIALSQLNRSVEHRGGDKKPLLSDLRESGAIEQDADLVAFIHRAEYYGQTTDENGESLRGIGEFIIAKHRNGSLGTAKLEFVSQYTSFKTLERQHFTTKTPIYNKNHSQNQDNTQQEAIPF